MKVGQVPGRLVPRAQQEAGVVVAVLRRAEAELLAVVAVSLKNRCSRGAIPTVVARLLRMAPVRLRGQPKQRDSTAPSHQEGSRELSSLQMYKQADARGMIGRLGRTVTGTAQMAAR